MDDPNYLDYVPAAASLIGGVSGMAGDFMNASAARQTGASAIAAGGYNASQARIAAGQAAAAGQVGASEEMRSAMLVNSTALARAAASGAGASDPTIINMMAQTQGRGAYLAGLKLYSGEEQQRQLLDKANADVYQSQLQNQSDQTRATTYDIAAPAALLRGISPIAAKYAYDAPPS